MFFQAEINKAATMPQKTRQVSSSRHHTCLNRHYTPFPFLLPFPHSLESYLRTTLVDLADWHNLRAEKLALTAGQLKECSSSNSSNHNSNNHSNNSNSGSNNEQQQLQKRHKTKLCARATLAACSALWLPLTLRWIYVDCIAYTQRVLKLPTWHNLNGNKFAFVRQVQIEWRCRRCCGWNGDGWGCRWRGSAEEGGIFLTKCN